MGLLHYRRLHIGVRQVDFGRSLALTYGSSHRSGTPSRMNYIYRHSPSCQKRKDWRADCHMSHMYVLSRRLGVIVHGTL